MISEFDRLVMILTGYQFYRDGIPSVKRVLDDAGATDDEIKRLKKEFPHLLKD